MPTSATDATADLRGLLTQVIEELGALPDSEAKACAERLRGLSDESMLLALEGELPRGVQPEGDFLEAAEALSAASVLNGSAGPRWRPMVIDLPPGLDQLLGIVEPPLNILVALLKLLVGFLAILRALLLSIPDPFEALIRAAVAALEAIIADILGSGGYLYADAPGLTSPDLTLAEAGYSVDLPKSFKAGQQEQGAPPLPPDGFAKWAARFQQSFDDPGDDQRPKVSAGAPVEAVFIVGAAPTLQDLARLAYLLGRLFNIEDFLLAWERFVKGSEDQGGDTVQGRPVAPNWEAFTITDIIPPMAVLEEVPALLEGLLSKVDGVLGLLADLAGALEAKAQVLLEMAEMLQDLIALLRSLESAGLYLLPVSTSDGVEGLRAAFEAATSRPEGGYVMGVCLLAAGPDLGKVGLLWEMLVGGSFVDAAVETWERVVEAKDETLAASEDFGDEVKESYDQLRDAILDAPQGLLDSIGRSQEQLMTLFEQSPAEALELWVSAAGEGAARDFARGRKQVPKGKGERGLSQYLGKQEER